MEWVSETWDGWWNPPTSEEMIRRARARVRRKCSEIERRVETEELKERQLVKKLSQLAEKSSPREKLESVARSIVAARESQKKLRGIQTSMNALMTHMEAVDSSVTVREVMQIAADAISAVGVGSARAIADDSRAIYTQLAQLQMMEDAASDAIGTEDGDTVADDLVSDIISQVSAAVELDMPAVPRSGPGPGMGGLEKGGALKCQ